MARKSLHRAGAQKHLEMHTHSFVSGPRSGGHYERDGWHTGSFSHSHEGGDVAHQHPQTGPSCYVIDKDEWARATGLQGGGRKAFTAKPTGEQFPIVELEDWQRSFEVIVVGDPMPEMGSGPGFAPAFRMILGHKITATFSDARRPA